MGLIKAAIGSVGGVLADQWKEFIFCDQLDMNTLVAKGQKKTSSFGRSSNTTAEDNIISNGSRIAVGVGQCMMIVEQGKVVEMCNEPGEFVYDKSSEPSIFTGDLKTGVKDMFKKMGERFTFGGDTGKDQRVYYFNMKEIMGNKYGTPGEVPFKSFDNVTGQVLLIRLRCFGEYSYRITNPLLFYTNVAAGNGEDHFDRSTLDSQLRSELRTALQPAFAKISAMRIDYTELVGHTMEIADSLNEILSKKWRDLRGIEIVSFGVDSIKANEDDEAKIQKAQMGMTMSNPMMAQGIIADATADAMRTAAGNQGGMGAMMGFMGMNMAGNVGANMYGQAGNQAQQMGMQPPMGMAPQPMQPQVGAMAAAPAPTPQTPQPAGWTCSCGQTGNIGKFCMSCGSPKPEPKPPEGAWDCECGQKGNTGKFCMGCGKPKPAATATEPEGWTCSCGTVNQGKFCMNCGNKKPEDAPLYKCDKCGWRPADPHHPPKFCPQCGDPFDEKDRE